jgi:hypothetical protein
VILYVCVCVWVCAVCVYMCGCVCVCGWVCAVCVCVCVCVCVALIIQHAMHMRRTVICGLPGSTKFFPHYLIKEIIFEKKLLITKCVF